MKDAFDVCDRDKDHAQENASFNAFSQAKYRFFGNFLRQKIY